MPLSISSTYPDIDLKDSEFINQLTNVAMQLNRQPLAKKTFAPTIELRFMLSGEHDSPDFTGMRMTSYNSDNRCLYIETAVPKPMNHSDKAFKYIMAALKDATENAEEFFDQQGSNFDAAEHMTSLDALLPRESITVN